MSDDERREIEMIGSLTIFSEAKSIVEIGVAYGETSKFLCEAARRNGGKYAGFDCWSPHGLIGQHITFGSRLGVYDMLSANGYSGFELIEIDTIKEGERLASELDRIFPNGIDLAFIDGCHSYLGVASDFSAIYPRLTTEGVIIFHDTVIVDGCREFVFDLSNRYYDGTYDIISIPRGWGIHRCGVSILVKKSYPLLDIGICEAAGSLSKMKEIEEKELSRYWDNVNFHNNRPDRENINIEEIRSKILYEEIKSNASRRKFD